MTPADVDRAASVLDGHVVRTPLARSETLSAVTGAEVWVKFENLQFTASYKERGALNRLQALTPGERSRGVVAMSAGNHAQGVAHQAVRLGIPVTVVMPRTTPNVKVARTEALGAEVVLAGEGFDEASAFALELCAAGSKVLIPPFDDPLVIAGQGTVALEMLQDGPGFDVVVVPTGGGGLLAGTAVVVKDRAPSTEVLGVQADGYAPLAARFGHGGAPGSPSTIAEGIAVTTPGRLTTPLIEALVDDVVAVSEDRIEQAVGLLVEIEKTVAEGAGAAALAAVLDDPPRFAGRRVGLILTGGNIDPRVLASVIMRSLVRSGRLARIRVEVSDVPGELARLATLLGAAGANIVEVAHSRHFPPITSRRVLVELDIECRDRHHTETVLQALTAAGLSAVEILD